MDILKAEIARKRKLLEEKKVLDPSTNKKYFKRGELLAKEQEEYLKKYGPKPEESQKSDVNDIPEKVNRQDSADAENDHTENAQLPRTEVIKRLRERAHPILLFGENELQSFKRLRRIEIQEPEANRVWHPLFMKPTPGTSTAAVRTSEVANAPLSKNARRKLRRLRQKREQQTAPSTEATVRNADGPSFFYKQRQNAKHVSASKPHAPPAKPTSLLVEAAGSDAGKGKEKTTKTNKRFNRQNRAAVAIARSAQASSAAPIMAPASIQVEPAKRKGLDDSVTPRGDRKKLKLGSSRRATTASNAEIAQSELGVAVVKTDNEKLTEEQAMALKKYLSSRMMDEALDSDISFTPRFQGKPTFTKGALKLWCNDVPTVEWLTSTIKQLPETSCLNLAVVKQCALTRKIRAAIFFPECTSTLKDTSILLEKQNKWAQINQWLFYNKKQTEHSLFVNIGIPETLIPVIMEKGRRLAFGLGNVYIRFFGAKGKLQDEPPSQQPRKTSPKQPQPEPGSSAKILTDRPGKPVPASTSHSPKPSCPTSMEDICESLDMELASDTEGNQDDGDPKPLLF